MAEKLSIQIALEGGAEIEKQLAGIGEAGQKAFADITKSAEQVGGFKNIKPDEVTAKLKEMGVTGVDSIKKIQDAVASAGKLETLVQGISSVETAFSALAQAAPIIGTVIVAAFAAATKAAFAFSDAVNKVSDDAARLGVSIEKLDQFRQGLEQAGISAKGISDALAQAKSNADQFKLDQVKRDAAEVQRALAGGFGADDAFKRLQKAADEFTPAGKAAREELFKMGQPIPGIGEGLQRLGDPIGGLKVTTKDVQELGTELAKLKTLGIDIKISDDAVTQAQKIITVLAQMPDQAKAAQIAMQQFGATGPELVAGLRTGSITIDQFKQKFATLTAEQEAAANKQRQITNRLSADWERFKVEVGAPIAIAGMTVLTEGMKVAAAFAAVLTEAFKVLAAQASVVGTIFSTMGSVINTVATGGAQVIAALAAPIMLVVNAVTSLVASLNINWSLVDAGVTAWNDIVSAVQGAGAAITTFVSNLGTITWDIISGAGVAAWNAIVTAVQGAGTAITDFVSKIGSITWDIISSVGVAAWNALTGAIQGAIDRLLQFLGLQQRAPAGGGGGGGGKAGGGLIGGRGTGTSDSNLAWLSRGEYVMPAAAVRQPGMLSFLEALRRSGHIPGFAAGGFQGPPIAGIKFPGDPADMMLKALQENTTVLERLGEMVGTLVQTVNGLVQSVAGLIKTAEETHLMTAMIWGLVIAINEKIDRAISRQAAGGLIGGRGTGTSDSNLAWVSRGEHIMPARAVRQPGVLAFLEALRRSGGNLSRVLDGMGRFALGGMIRGPMPAFASGGMVGGHLGTLTLGLPSGESVTVRASSGVVDQLRREAALAQVRSGGRKPSRYS